MPGFPEFRMARQSLVEYRTTGGVWIDRIGVKGVSGLVKAPLEGFKVASEAYEAASAKVDAAEVARDAALEALGVADALLDAEVNALADDLVAAKMGSRARPFAGFGALPPSQIVVLAHAREIKAVNALVKKVKRAKPPPKVRKRLVAVERRVAGVEAAQLAVVGPEFAYQIARGQRDALLPEWTAAARRLKTIARAAWIDEPGRYASVFAPVEAIVLGKVVRRRKGEGRGKGR